MLLILLAMNTKTKRNPYPTKKTTASRNCHPKGFDILKEDISARTIDSKTRKQRKFILYPKPIAIIPMLHTEPEHDQH